MPVEKSDYEVKQLNTQFDLEMIQKTKKAKKIVGYLSVFSPDFNLKQIDRKTVDILFINGLDFQPDDAVFAWLTDLAQNLPVFLLINSTSFRHVPEALKQKDQLTICYAQGQIDLFSDANWVPWIEQNRTGTFLRTADDNELGFDELLCALDANRKIQCCSQEFCDYVGLSVDQVLQADILTWIDSETKKKETTQRIQELAASSEAISDVKQVVPFRGNKKNTLFYASYERSTSESGTVVWFHSQNHLNVITETYQNKRKYFSDLFDFFHDAILVIDFMGYILDFNEPFDQMFGYSRQTLLMSSAIMLFPSIEVYEQSRRQLLNKKKIQLASLRKANGELFISEVSFSILHDGEGKEWGYFLLFRDISERERLIEEKAKIEQRLKRSQKIAKLASWKYDFRQGTIDFSEELYQMMNLEKGFGPVDKEVLLSKWILAEDVQNIRHFFKNIKSSAQKDSGLEFRILFNDQQVRYIYIEASDLQVDEKYQVIEVEGILQDITERRKAELTSLQKDLQIQNFINEMDGGYARYQIVANDKGEFDNAVLIETNENFEKLLGISPTEALGKTFTSFLPQIDPGVLKTGIQVALEGNSTEIHNDIFDENRWFDLKIYRPAEGQFVISFYDVADREKDSIQIHKQNKYLRAMQETIRELLVLRDINTLLQNILDRACTMVGSELGFLDFMEPGGTNRYPRFTHGNLADALTFPVQKGVGLTGTVWLEGKPLFIEKYDEWENRLPDFRKAYISSVLGIPLLSYGHVVGVLVIAREYESDLSFGDEDIDILNQFAQMTTLAIENAQLLEKFQKEISDRKFIEERLRKSEENYRTLFENIPDGIYRTTPKGEFLTVNPAMIKLLGYDSFQDLAKINAADCYFDAEERKDFITGFSENKDIYSAEVHLKRKDGTLLYALENGRAKRDEHGNYLYFEGTITNITERKIAQQLLEKQSNELARLYRASESLFFDQAKTLEHLANTIISSVSKEFDQVNCSLFMYHEAENALYLLAQSNRGDGCKDIRFLPLDGKGIITRAVRQRSVMNVPDVSKDEDYIENWVNTCSELCIPLMIQEQVLGILNIESDTCDVFDDDDIRLLSIFAEKAAFSLQQSLNNKKEQQRFEKLLQIQNLGTELSLVHDEKSILDTMMRYIRSISPKSNCIVLIFDYLQSGYRIAAHAGFNDTYRPDKNEIIPNKSLIYHLQQNNIYYSGDLEKVMPSIREVFPASSNEKFVSFSLIHEGEVLGTILLTGEFASSKEDDAIIEVLAKIVSSALTNARLFKSTNLALERLAALRRIDLAISSSTDITFMVDVLLEQLNSQLYVDATDVLLYSAANYQFTYCSGRGIQSHKFMRSTVRLGEGITGKAAFKRSLVFIKDLRKEADLDLRLMEMIEDGYISYIGIPIVAKGAIKGMLEIYHREILNPAKDWMDYLEIISGQAAIAIESIDLFANLQRSNTDLSLAYDSTLEGWASALELRDKETEGHTRRVAELTIELAIAMNVKPDDLKNIRWGALLHDIGKMGIPDEILLKPGALTEEEWEVMRKHPVYAYELLSKIDYLHHALDIPYCHHEKWDGSGYPRKLKGEEIPLSARIFSVIDVWDALTSDRPYRKAWSKEKTMAYIQEQSGTHFDPKVVGHFRQIMDM